MFLLELGITIWGWVFICIGLVFFSIFSYRENEGDGIAVGLGFAIILGTLFYNGIISLSFNLLWYAAGYILIGFFWSFFKWYKYISSFKKDCLNLLKDQTAYMYDFHHFFISLKESKTDIKYKNFSKTTNKNICSLYSTEEKTVYFIIPSLSYNIVFLYVLGFPISMIKYFFGDFLYDIIVLIAKKFSGVYNLITKYVLR